MGKTRKSSKKKKTSQSTSSSNNVSRNEGLIEVDPQRIRFQHSRIRPHFSGCGRSVVSTLESIRNGDISTSDIPPILVIEGPDEDDGLGPWYFSLNNRRLWVFKRLRDEGLLLPTNMIRVRVRKPKSKGEFERYNLTNCAIEAKFIRELDPKKVKANEENYDNQTEEIEAEIVKSFEIVEIEDINEEADKDINEGSLIESSNDNSSLHSDANDDVKDDALEADDIDLTHNFQAMRRNRFCFDELSDDDSTDST